MGGDDEIGACELEVSVDQYAKQISHLIWIKVNKKRTSGRIPIPGNTKYSIAATYWILGERVTSTRWSMPRHLVIPTYHALTTEWNMIEGNVPRKGIPSS